MARVASGFHRRRQTARPAPAPWRRRRGRRCGRGAPVARRRRRLRHHRLVDGQHHQREKDREKNALFHGRSFSAGRQAAARDRSPAWRADGSGRRAAAPARVHGRARALDGLHRVLGARRLEAARAAGKRRRAGADTRERARSRNGVTCGSRIRPIVRLPQPAQGALQIGGERAVRRIDAARAAQSRRRPSACGRTRAAKAGRSARNSARSRRLARLRATAPPTRRDAITPRRSQSSAFGSADERQEPRAHAASLRARRGRTPRGVAGGRADRTPGPCGRSRNGQPLAALGAAALEHDAAVLGAHPDEKPVRAPASAPIRLKRTFHGTPSLPGHRRRRQAPAGNGQTGSLSGQSGRQEKHGS